MDDKQLEGLQSIVEKAEKGEIESLVVGYKTTDNTIGTFAFGDYITAYGLCQNNINNIFKRQLLNN